MTIEEKAKAYDEALERAKKYNIDDAHAYQGTIVKLIFPELAKSEDEKIRKEMIRYFTEMKKGGSAALPYDDCIAYLERQKEIGIRWLKSDNVKNPDKPYIDKAGMFYTTDGRMCHASEIEKQKVAEWGELQWGELQSEFKNINEAFEDGKREVVAHPERYGLCECVPAEWGEEDSDNLERVDNYLWMLDNYVGDDCAMPQGKAYNIRENIQEVLSPWLKSLPGSFNLQPRQEWGEEDRDTLLMAATVLKANFDSDEKFEDCDYDCGTLAGKLLEMRYRISPSWKPSEEEMEALREAAEHSFYAGEGAALRTLYNDLQKRYGTC